MFNVGDKVRFASGKTEYAVVASNGGTVTIKSTNTGKVQTVHEDRLRLVRSVNSGRDSDAARAIAFGEAVKVPTESFNGAVDEVEVKPGDHRLSNYGIAILLALQTKLRPIGVKTRKGRGRKASR